jgi:bacterioferritin
MIFWQVKLCPQPKICKKENNMKGSEQVIAALNEALAEELTAISQYMVHSEMCDNWGYGKLHAAIEKNAIDEMKHAEKIIGRIIFLEGRPIVSELKKFHIGDTVEKMMKNDLALEQGAVKMYNGFVKLAAELGDNGTREMLESILKDEEGHVDFQEAQIDQMTQMGVQIYLGQQVKG